MSPFVPAESVRHGDRLLGRAVLLLLLGIYTLTFVGMPDNPDAEVEYQTTSALARTRRLAIGGTPESEALIAYAQTAEEPFGVHEGGPGREGRYYSWFGIGQALVGLPFWMAGAGLERVLPHIEERHRATTHLGVQRSEYFQHLLVGWRNPLLGAGTAALLLLSARRLGVSRRRAWMLALTYGLCTFAWPQARSSLSDVQATFLLFLCFHQVLRLRECYSCLQRPRAADLVLLGGAAGGAFLTRVLTAPAVAVLAVATLFVVLQGRRRLASSENRRRREPFFRVLLLAGLPALLAVAAFLALNRMRFGDPLETGYPVRHGFFSYPPWLGLAGLLVSPGKGLLWMAPLVLLVPVGIARARDRGERLWPWTTAAMLLAVAGPVSFMQGWEGGPNFGPRYLLPVLPFLWLGVGLGWEHLAQRTRLSWLAGALAGLGLLVNLPGVLVDASTHHDVGLQAARLLWPDVPDDPAAPDRAELRRDAARYLNMQWDWRFAAPWAHWRILRHRLAHGDTPRAEALPPCEIFFVDADTTLTPALERDRGFRHLAWVDLKQRLGGPGWTGLLVCAPLLAAGAFLALRGLDRTLP